MVVNAIGYGVEIDLFKEDDYDTVGMDDAFYLERLAAMSAGISREAPSLQLLCARQINRELDQYDFSHYLPPATRPGGHAFSGADFGSFANATALKAALLENYDVTTPPPRANLSRGVLVRVQFAMQQFTLLDTTKQFITFHSWWRHYWVDPRLS